MESFEFHGGMAVGHQGLQYQQADDGDRAGEDGGKRADPEPLEKGDVAAGAFFEHAERDDVGGAADHGDIAAEAGAEKQGPPEGQVFDAAGELFDHGTEGGHENHVVDEGRTDGGNDENERAPGFRRSCRTPR